MTVPLQIASSNVATGQPVLPRSQQIALLFPGQGAQSPRMIEGVRELPEFGKRYEIICDHTGIDVVREIASGNEPLLNVNVVSSLLTVLVSSLSLDVLRDREGVQPAFLAGYSVGQWSAMYAAEMISFEQLVVVLVERARLMDACVVREPGAMCAVIGIPEAGLTTIVEQLRLESHRIFISNYNCPGQYSIAGTVGAIALAEERISALRPKKLLRLAVSGAWHCPILQDAEKLFMKVLEEVDLQSPTCPVVDNVTGGWLPTDRARLRTHLARHLSHPVYWERGMQHLLANGCTEFIEVGFGNNLTKFGFFIDRDHGWRTYYN